MAEFKTKYNIEDIVFKIVFCGRYDDDGTKYEIREAIITGIGVYQARRRKEVEINYYTDSKDGAIKEDDLFKTKKEAILAAENLIK